MSTKLVVDSANQLKELSDSESFQHPYFIRLAAKIISYVFHPIFVPVYIVLFLLYISSGVFAGVNDWNKKVVLMQAVLMYSFFPLVTVLLLKALKFVDSVFLDTQRDRIIPFVVCIIWYFWICYVWNNLPGYPKEIVVLAAAIFLAAWIGLMANIYMKISMHMIAMGVATGFLMLLGFKQSSGFGLYIAVTLLVTGLVATSRFIISDHKPKEIYGGLFAGIAALVVAELLRGIFY
ncbi:MAG: hypothetical protein Q8941_09375 [Bacteroidota bacterium]|nr:hypothetical protein [Bacteroidota bacterium]